MTTPDLMKEAFDNLNGFKRSRALEQVEREKGHINNASGHKLRQYEYIDKLELSLRAIQKEIRNTQESK